MRKAIRGISNCGHFCGRLVEKEQNTARSQSPLSDQEQRCINVVCRYLEDRFGGSWSVQTILDNIHLSEPSPEAIVGNGEMTAAIEVKRLTGDSVLQAYTSSLLSNEKFLTPSCGGSYYLVPPLDFRLPMAQELRRLVKRETERVAQMLAPGQRGAIRIPRQGHIALISQSSPGFISCLHQGPHSDLIGKVQDQINGKFMLVDEGLEHSFVTEECQTAFVQAVVNACNARRSGDAEPFGWEEEWELGRNDEYDTDGEDGVWIVAVTEARSMPESVEECVHSMVQKAIKKFESRRWADLHFIVLEASLFAPTTLAAEAVKSFALSDRSSVDSILLVDGENIFEAEELAASLAKDVETKEKQRELLIINRGSPKNEYSDSRRII